MFISHLRFISTYLTCEFTARELTRYLPTNDVRYKLPNSAARATAHKRIIALFLLISFLPLDLGCLKQSTVVF